MSAVGDDPEEPRGRDAIVEHDRQPLASASTAACHLGLSNSTGTVRVANTTTGSLAVPDAAVEETGQQARYAVGYGRPPRATRFQKGKSGNPKGRPKGSRSAKSLLEQALAAPVSISEGGTTRVIEQRMALFKSLVARAIKGDARAAALVVRLMEQFERQTPPEEHQPITVIERRIVRPGDPGTAPVWHKDGRAT